jgi:homoserine O-acetyltransferase
MKSALLVCLCLFAQLQIAQAQRLELARLGDCPLESGNRILDCEVGYRIFGTLNETRSNAVLVPTWANGTSEQWISLIGPGKLLDSDNYFIIVVDSLCNGISSSPSNSKRQRRMHFPRITIHDMVATDHTLLAQHLHLQHLYAIVGQSMAGMQAFDWIVSYPEFMDKAVIIVGSPRLASFDLLMWQTQIDQIESNPKWHHGKYAENPLGLAEVRLSTLFLTTPDAVNRRVIDGALAPETVTAAASVDANNRIRQMEAMLTQDVSKSAGNSLAQAAARVRAKSLVIVARHDHVVTPRPALEFAQLIGAQIEVLESDCGHLATSCEADFLVSLVHDFL